MKPSIMIPKTMSTQHPDNAAIPPWTKGTMIEGEAELHEAFFAYSRLGCDEVMWDSEGKDVDTNVVRKLLSAYPDYFRKEVIGEDVFLTYRIPNPQIEVAERKIVTETLQTIPLSADVCSLFYNRRVVPVFEVILPFTRSGRELLWLHEYYRKAIAGAEKVSLSDTTVVKDWVGPFFPKKLRVIPLVEDFESIINVDRIVLEYAKVVRPDHLRVFLARSDPALNYGLFTSTLLSKIALWKLASLRSTSRVEIHPIIGVGSLPFRGHLAPGNISKFLDEYRGLSTVTTQSAMRYDYPPEEARRAVEALNQSLPNGKAHYIGAEQERVLKDVAAKLVPRYQSRIELLAPLINSIAAFVPSRRARKLHIGLFGYSRRVRGVAMPRAIPFAASFYSIGIPPEFIGAEALQDLSEAEFKALVGCYHNISHDLGTAGSYVSWESINMMMDVHPKLAKRAGMGRDALRAALGALMSDLSTAEDLFSIHLAPRNNTEKRHENFINNFLISYMETDQREAEVAFLEAAKLRRCLG